MHAVTADDIAEFRAYLRLCTDLQVRAVYEKEKAARREVYASLATMEAEQRGIAL